MPFVELDLEKDYEDKPVPEGVYPLRIIKADDKESKKGNAMTQLFIGIESDEYPDASPFNHFLVYPNKDTEPDTRRLFMQNITRTLAVFGVKYDANGFDSDDLVGAEGESLVELKPAGSTDDGKDFPEQNALRAPRLRKEGKE